MTKKYEVNLTQHAQEDLEHIFYYIATDNTNTASKFFIELEEKVYSLEHLPNRNPLIPENENVGTDYRHLIYENIDKYRVLEN